MGPQELFRVQNSGRPFTYPMSEVTSMPMLAAAITAVAIHPMYLRRPLTAIYAQLDISACQFSLSCWQLIRNPSQRFCPGHSFSDLIEAALRQLILTRAASVKRTARPRRKPLTALKATRHGQPDSLIGLLTYRMPWLQQDASRHILTRKIRSKVVGNDSFSREIHYPKIGIA